MAAKYTWRRFRLSLAAAGFLVLLRAGVRCAEYRQVGYTNDASMWIFVAAGLCAYYAAIVASVLRRGARRKSGPPPQNKPDISD